MYIYKYVCMYMFVGIYIFIMNLGKAILRKMINFILDKRMDIEHKLSSS